MSFTLLSDVSNQVEKFWAPMFVPELMQKTPLASLVNKNYQGDIKAGGNTVRVSQITRPAGQIKTIGTDAESFDSSLLSTSYVDVVANKRISAAFELEDLIDLQSQLGQENSAIRNALTEAIMIKLNQYLYDFVAPSASAPDHVITGVTDFNASQLIAVRNLASAAKWSMDPGWFLLASSSYYGDLLASQTLASSDYVGAEAPTIGGQIVKQRFGFNIVEDNSDGLLSLGTSGADCALAFHPDFLHLVVQRQPTFKLSDMHSSKKFGYVLSVDMVVGAAIGNQGSLKHISVINS